MKGKFAVGDIVFINKPGLVHSTYESMFKELDFTNQVSNGLYLDDLRNLRTKPWVVWAVTTHPMTRTYLYALQTLDSSGRQILIQEGGIDTGHIITSSIDEAIFIMNIELSQE